MTTSRPLPPHGTTARAKGRPASGLRGCSCPTCRAARNRYNKQRRYLNATGRPARVAAGPVADHIRGLLDAGMAWHDLAAGSGCSTATLSALLRGQRTMRRVVARRVLAVRFAPSAAHMVDAVGSVRRVRALYAAGHMQKAIARDSGLNRSTVADLLGGRLETVSVATARAVREAFERLEMRGAPEGVGAVRARNRGAREGWAWPLAWGEDMDDPHARPLVDAPTERTPRPLVVAEDAEFVRRTTGVTNPDLIAARLRITRETLDRNLERAKALRAQESVAA